MRIILVLLLFFFACSPNANAFFDAIISAAQAAKEEAYEKFMMLKAVEQLKSLKDNYEASMRYYAMYKQLNEGKGILPNIAQKVGDIGDNVAKQAQQQFDDDWIYSKGYGSDIDKTVSKMDQYSSDKVRYAGQVFSKALEAQTEGQKISSEADGLDTKTTQKMILKTQALQLQLAAQTNANMAQLLEVNTRMYQLQQEQKEERLQDWDVFDKSIKIFKAGLDSQGGN